MKRILGIAALVAIGVVGFANAGTQRIETRSNSVVTTPQPIQAETSERQSNVGVIGLFATSMILASKVRKEKI